MVSVLTAKNRKYAVCRPVRNHVVHLPPTFKTPHLRLLDGSRRSPLRILLFIAENIDRSATGGDCAAENYCLELLKSKP